MPNLNQKIKSLFIAGFDGDKSSEDEIFAKNLRDGLGGVIFFTKNITGAENFKRLICEIKNNALFPPFLSIDQEGGRVERTENIHNGKKYLSARFAAQKGEEFLKNQTEELCSELKNFGINMNFAPVLDVDTNPDNPIIGERSYSNNPEDVVKFAKIVADIHLKHGIIPVGKHFPGHGDTNVDSHKGLPVVDLPVEEFQKHLYPFEKMKDLPAFMVAHILFPFFDEENPSSLSEKIVTGLLREKMRYEGLILSDDMVMGAVKDIPNAFEKGLKAGINMFIYRNADENFEKIVFGLEEKVKTDKELRFAVENSFEKITVLKNLFL